LRCTETLVFRKGLARLANARGGGGKTTFLIQS
jgi:hypothetical protein